MTRRITDLPTVQGFRAAAQAYCAAIDQHEGLAPLELVRRVYPILGELTARAVALPDPISAQSLARDDDHFGKWKALFTSLTAQLSGWKWYWTTDPFGVPGEEPSCGDLADDLADIYFDLKYGLEAWEAADASLRRDLVWDWRFMHEAHWGHHAVDALRVIHTLLRRHAVHDLPDPHDVVLAATPRHPDAADTVTTPAS